MVEQDESEDSKELFLNAQCVLKLCVPPVHLYSKPVELRGRWHYSFSEGSKNDVRDAKQKKSQHYLQARLSDVSFATFEEANCWHAKRAYAEILLAERLPPADHAPKPIPVGTFFVCEFFWNANTPISRIKMFVFCTFTVFSPPPRISIDPTS